MVSTTGLLQFYFRKVVFKISFLVQRVRIEFGDRPGQRKLPEVHMYEHPFAYIVYLMILPASIAILVIHVFSFALMTEILTDPRTINRLLRLDRQCGFSLLSTDKLITFLVGSFWAATSFHHLLCKREHRGYQFQDMELLQEP